MSSVSEGRIAVRSAPLAIELSTMLGWAIAFGMCSVSYYVLRGLFNFTEGVAGAIVGWVPGVGKWVNHKLEAAEQKMTTWVGSAAAAAENRMADAFHASANLMQSIGHEIFGMAVAYWQLAQWVGKLSHAVASGEAWDEVFHNTIRAQSETTAQMYKRLNAQGKAITHADSPPVAAGVKRMTRAERARLSMMTDVTLPRLRDHTRAREDALSRDAEAIREGARTVEGQLEGLWQRVRHLDRITTGTLSVALVGTALGRLGLGRLGCSNVGRAMKGLCGMNPSALEELLGLTLAVLSPIGLRDLAIACQEVTEETAAAVQWFAGDR